MNSQCFEHLYPSNQTPLHSQCFKRSIAQAHGNVRRQQSNISSEGESQGGGRVPTCCYVSKKIMHWCRRSGNVQTSSTLLDLCVSSLRRGHANFLCIDPILTDVPRKESRDFPFCRRLLPRVRASKNSVSPWGRRRLSELPTNGGALVAGQKIVYSSRFVRVILAQGPC